MKISNKTLNIARGVLALSVINMAALLVAFALPRAAENISAAGFADVVINPGEVGTISMTVAESDGTNDGTLNLGAITPTPDGNINSAFLTASVTTNSPSGYLLSIYGDQDLVHTLDSQYTLTPVGGSLLSPVAFAGNCEKWGFALPRLQSGMYGLAPNRFKPTYSVENSSSALFSQNVWMGMPSSALPIKRMNKPVTNDTTQIFFAACADNNTTTGTYQGSVTLEARIANPTATGDGIGDETNINVDLDNNLIPVVYTGTGVSPEWRVADETNAGNAWYSYADKQWANAVTVTAAALSANTYIDSGGNYLTGTVVAEADVLGYWTYIPRYRYQVQTINYALRPTVPRLFSILFEDKNDPNYEKADPNNMQIQIMEGDFITHPAFTLGTTELNGLWVAKFEATGTNVAPTVKPNLTSLRSQNILAQWNTSTAIRTTHALSSSYNTRMARNSDWGAIAYLASSMYGTGVTNSNVGEPGLNGGASEGGIRINSNTAYTTGCGPLNNAGSTATYAGGTTCTPTSDEIDRSYYTELGRFASSTGNPSGIYDLSGGAYEYTLANFAGTVGSSGLTSNGSGGFTQIDSKYIDFYPTGTTMTNCDTVSGGSFATCAGQALFETAGWNSDDAIFVPSSSPWSIRGGNFSAGSRAGVFSSYYTYGSAGTNFGFRPLMSVF